MLKITKDNKTWLFKSKFYTLNYKINSKIFIFNYH